MADEAEKSDSRRVVGVDGSESSVRALRRAAEIAEALSMPVEATMTWENPVMLANPPDAPPAGG
ncbi:universal stress protein [Promicromonospora sp. NPDC090134]|uniref:universal stress protein n=1 Tax=Promicromonospora sp. NPDC090134 TaxID=3364408 RepID=UPI00380F94C0